MFDEVERLAGCESGKRAVLRELSTDPHPERHRFRRFGVRHRTGGRLGDAVRRRELAAMGKQSMDLGFSVVGDAFHVIGDIRLP